MEAAEQAGVSESAKSSFLKRTLIGKGMDRGASGAALLRERLCPHSWWLVSSGCESVDV